MEEAMKKYHYRLKRFDEIYDLSREIANLFPQADMVHTGVYELLINALEHGNLGIGYKLKNLLLKQRRWEEEISRRLAHPANREKYVDITVIKNEKLCLLTVSDQGPGFDWKEYINYEPVHHRHRLHGRGLLIARSCGLSPLFFNDSGNQVSCLVVNL